MFVKGLGSSQLPNERQQSEATSRGGHCGTMAQPALAASGEAALDLNLSPFSREFLMAQP